MTNRKPIQVYLDTDERSQLEVLKKAFDCKTYSTTFKAILNLIFNLKNNEK